MSNNQVNFMNMTQIPAAQNRVEITVISLTSAEKRRYATTMMLNKANLTWKFFDAHHNLACEELSYKRKNAITRFGRPLTNQETAIYSSHYSVWKNFLEKNSADYLLVLEDDVLIDIDFPLNEFIDYCSKANLHYVRLFAKHYAGAAHLGFFYDRSLLRFKTSPTGAQAYVLSATGARRLVERCRSVDMAVDLSMDRFWHTGLPLYSIYPYPVIERFVPTSNPITEAGCIKSRRETWQWNAYRARNKVLKIAGNLKLSSNDTFLRKNLPIFNQVF